jgi:hypothetical protein
LAFMALTNALEQEKDWAVKLFFQYNFGMPKQMIETKSLDEKPKHLVIKINRKDEDI